MKNRLFVLLAILVALLIGSGIYYLISSKRITPSAQTTGATMALSPASGTYDIGDEFDVNVNIATGGLTINAVQFELSYEPTLVEVVDANSGVSGIQITNNSLFETEMSNSVSSGKINFSAVTLSSDGYNGSNSTATIKFKALASGEAASQFNMAYTKMTTSEGTGDNVLTSATGGTYTIGDGSTVEPPQVNPPTVDIKANNQNQLSITSGTAVTLSWSSTNAETCTGAGDWSGAKATSGTYFTGNIATAKSYVLTCTNSAGNATDEVVISVTANTNTTTPTTNTTTPTPTTTTTTVSKPTIDVKINNLDGTITIDKNSTATLTWRASNVTSCTASGSWQGIKGPNGEEKIQDTSTGKTFTLTCTNAAGTANDSAGFNVKTTTVSTTTNSTVPKTTNTPSTNTATAPSTNTNTNTNTATTPLTNENSSQTEIPANTAPIAQVPENITPTTPEQPKGEEIYLGDTVKPASLWILYAVIPGALAVAATVIFYLNRRKKI